MFTTYHTCVSCSVLKCYVEWTCSWAISMTLPCFCMQEQKALEKLIEELKAQDPAPAPDMSTPKRKPSDQTPASDKKQTPPKPSPKPDGDDEELSEASLG